MARMCIVSRKEVGPKEGTPIRDDAIISTIRKIKKRLGILQNNELVVSEEKLEEYKKKRSKFEKMAVIHVTVAAILVLLLALGPIMLGMPFDVVRIFFALLLGAMVAALALLSYIPALETGEGTQKPSTANDVVKRLSRGAPKPKRRKKKK
jgi:p-aminobenzoyl-glutamate transporter AbgT